MVERRKAKVEAGGRNRGRNQWPTPWRFVIDRVFHASQVPLRDPPDRSASYGRGPDGRREEAREGARQDSKPVPAGPLPEPLPERCGARTKAKAATRAETRGAARIEVGVLSRPPPPKVGSGSGNTAPTAPRERSGGRGRDRTPNSGTDPTGKREDSAVTRGRLAADPLLRLGKKRIGGDSRPNRNVPPGVLSRRPKNPQAIGTIRWSLVAGVLEFCRATRDSLLESCRANY